MRYMTTDLRKLLRWGAVFLMCAAVFLGYQMDSPNVLSQETDKTVSPTETTVQDDEKSLVKIIKNRELRKTSPEKVVEALKKLKYIATNERIASTETIEALIENIDLSDDSQPKEGIQSSTHPGFRIYMHEITPDEIYPAVGALENIGKVAFPALLNVIKTTEPDSISSNNALFALKYNFREDLTKAADYLQKAADTEYGESRQRLLLAADRVLPKNPS